MHQQKIKGIMASMATYSTVVGARCNMPLLALFLILSSSGCLFGGKKETTEVATVTQPGPTANVNSPSSTREPEKTKEIKDIPVERQEMYDDMLSRLNSLERDYQFLKDKVSMLEFLAGDASRDSKKTKEEMRAELEKLRAQLSEYNALVLRILTRLGKESERQEPSPPPRQ